MSCYYGHPEFTDSCSYCREEKYKTRNKVEMYIEELEAYIDDVEHQLTKIQIVLANLKHEQKLKNF